MQVSVTTIKKSLKKRLDASRYDHTMGVAYTAICLAMKYEVDLYKAEVAGLLHDCAKCIPDNTKIAKCQKYNISITDIEYDNPSLLHAKLGAFYAMNKYGIADMEIINAILNHTTGKPAMTMLEKIVYVADYIEPRRTKAPNLTQIRKLAFEDIDLAVFKIMEGTIAFVKERNLPMDKITELAYDYYKKLYHEEKGDLDESIERNGETSL